MKPADDLTKCYHLIEAWTQCWGVPELAEDIQCEWSSRLRRSLGRAYPKRQLVRLSVLLKAPKFSALFDEVLCHETAHIAAFHIQGGRVANHGVEWRSLVRRAGFVPRSSFPTESASPRNPPHPVRYEHFCPVCQASRYAKQPQPKWRCVICQEAGLDGKLIIQSRPVAREATDA